MINYLTNINSEIRVTSMYKHANDEEFQQTVLNGYTSISPQDIIKLSFSNVSFSQEKRYSSVTLIVQFSSIPLHTVFTLKDENDNVVDLVQMEEVSPSDPNLSTSYVSFDITSHILNNRGNEQIGSLFLTSDRNNNLSFLSFEYIDSQNQNDSSSTVYIQLIYSDLTGKHDFIEYKSFSLGSSGTLDVSLPSGNIFFKTQLMLSNLAVPTLDISFMYSSIVNEWRLSQNYGILEDTNEHTFEITTPDFNKYVFYMLDDDEKKSLVYTTDENIYYCYENSSYIITGNGVDFVLHLNDGTTISFQLFYEMMEISSITYKNGHTFEFTYYKTDNSILHALDLKTIEDENDVISFHYKPDYSHSQKLVRISSENKSIDAEILYDTDLIKAINVYRNEFVPFKENNTDRVLIKSTLFDYEDDKLARITNLVEKKKIEIVYDEFERACSITELIIDDDSVSSTFNETNFEYTDSYTSVQKDDDLYQHYFDSYGSTIYVLDSNGRAINLTYSKISDFDEDANCHRLSNINAISFGAKNYVENGSFDYLDYLDGWDIDDEDVTISQIDDSTNNSKALSLYNHGNNSVTLTQTIEIDKPGTYLFSLLYNIQQSLNSDYSIDLSIAYTEKLYRSPSDPLFDILDPNTHYQNSSRQIVKSFSLTQELDVWNTLNKTIEIPVGSEVVISVLIPSGGQIVLNNISLIKSQNINLIKNHSFDDGVLLPFSFANQSTYEFVDVSSITSNNNHLDHLDGNALHIPQSNSVTEDILIQQIKHGGDENQIFTFSMWLKSYINSEEDIDIEISFLNENNNIINKNHLYPTKHIDDWQMVSGSFISEAQFKSIGLKIIKNGFHEAFYDELVLKTNCDSTYFAYDQKGNVVSLSEGIIQNAYYDNNHKIVSQLDSNNECLSYQYGSNGKITSIIDNFGNILTFDYDEDTTTKTVSNGSESIVTSVTSSNGLTTKTDEFGHTTQEARDEFGNIVGTTNQKGVCVSNTFNHQFRIKKIERIFLANVLVTVELKYDDYGKPTSIDLSNGTSYDFQYDSRNRLITSSSNGIEISSFEYRNNEESPYKTTVNSSTFELMYIDNKLRGYVVNDVEQYSFVLDDLNRIIVYQNETDSSKTYLTYNDDGQVLSKHGNNIEYQLEYDNLKNIQKDNINSDGEIVSIDYIRDYEFNEDTIHPFVQRLIDDFNDDVVLGIEGPSSRFGEYQSMRNRRFMHDDDLGYPVLQIYKNDGALNYDLSQVNNQRCAVQSINHHFDKSLFHSLFAETKNIYGWFKVDFAPNEMSSSTLFVFYDEDDNVIGEISISVNNRMIFSFNGVTQRTPPLSLTNHWFMLYVSMKEQGNSASIKFYVNGTLMCTMSIPTGFVASFTNLSVGYQTTQSSLGFLEGRSTKVGILAFGGGLVSANDVLSLYNEGQKALFHETPHQKYAGVKTTILDGDAEYFSLNGSFIGSKNTKPIKVSSYNPSHKIKKNQYFEFDNVLKQHVYSSFDNNNDSLLKERPLLSYDFDIQNSFYLLLDFKLENLSCSDDRTIISFTDTSNDYPLLIFVDENSNLYANETLVVSNVLADEWHTLSISFVNNTLSISYDSGNAVMVPNALLTGLLTHIACLPDIQDGEPTSILQLNGYIKDIYVSTSPITVSEQKVSVIKTIDTFGRITSIQIGPVSKTLYYEQPVDENNDPITGRTSLRVSQETNTLNDVINYSYDSVGNLINRTINNDSINYEYDGFDRLTKSSSSSFETNYSYDSNGDIQSIVSTDSNENEVSKSFEYDIFKRLTKIIDNNVDVNITYPSNSTLYPSQIGNMSLTWTGYLLTTVSINNVQYTYSYDFNHKLVKKIAQSQTTTYFYQDEKLIQEQFNSGDKTIYLYDEADQPIGFVIFSNQTSNNYYYIKDELGIINKVIDSNGTVVVQYTYDEFGKLLAATGQNSVIQSNHIIYKGYFYDFDLEMYLLGKRFYYPYICRFISPDKVDNIFKNVAEYVQFNLFAYCDNSPLIRADNSGDSWIKNMIVAVIIAVIVIAIVVPVIIVTAIGVANANSKAESFTDWLAEFKSSVIETMHLAYVSAKTAYLYFESFYLNNNIPFKMYFNHDFSKTLKNYLFSNYQGLLTLAGIAGDLCYSYCGDTIKQSIKNNYLNNVLVLNNCISEFLANPEHNDSVFEQLPQFADRIWFNRQDGDSQKLIMFHNSSLEDVGCGLIAVFNALTFLEEAIFTGEYIANLISTFEYKSIFLGKIGIIQSQIEDFLKTNKIEYKVFYSKSDLIAYLSHLNCLLTDIGIISTTFNQESYNNFYSNLMMHTTFIGFYKEGSGEEETYKYVSFNDNDSEHDNVIDHWDREHGENAFVSCIVIKKKEK